MKYKLLSNKVNNEDVYVAFDITNGTIIKLDRDIYLILKNKFPKNKEKGILNKLDFLLKKNRKVPKILYDELNFYNLTQLKINVSGDCNLSCSYCYANFGKYSNKKTGFMDSNTIFNVIKKLSTIYLKINNISFFGGEPLLNQKVIIDAMDYISNNIDYSDDINYSIDTNGTLPIENTIIDKCDFFVSVDGEKEIHNKLRIDKNGNPTYDAIKSNLKNLRERNKNFKYGIQCSYSKDLLNKNPNLSEIVEKILLDFSPHTIMFNPIFLDEENKINIIKFYKKTIDTLFDEHNNIKTNKVFIGDKSILTLIYLIIGGIKASYHCPAARDSFTISYDGNVYPCHLFMKNEYKIANVNYDSVAEIKNKIIEFNDKSKYIFKINSQKCNSCWAKNFCVGCVGKFKIYKEKNDLFCTMIKSILEYIILKIAYMKSHPEKWNKFLNKVEGVYKNENN